MKLTFILPTLQTGGAEIMVLNMISELEKRGIPIQLIVLGGKKKIDTSRYSILAKSYLLGFSSFQSVSFLSIKQSVKVASKVKQALDIFQPTHVISSLPIAHFVMRVASALSKFKFKHYTYHHATEFIENPPDTFAKHVFLKANQWLSNKYDTGHIYISEAVQNDIEQFFTTKGFILYNAVPFVHVSENEKEEVYKEWKLSKKFAIIPGRLTPVKGHLPFLDSCADTIRNHNQQLVIAGSGDLREKLEKKVKEKRIDHLVIFTGEVTNHKMLTLIAASQFVVIPSLKEGLGNVAIESIMLGKTVLASSAGGLPEVLMSDYGYLFKNNNSADLKLKFQQMVLDFSSFELNPHRLINYFKSKFMLDSQVQTLLSNL